MRIYACDGRGIVLIVAPSGMVKVNHKIGLGVEGILAKLIPELDHHDDVTSPKNS
jgi:hypothetical protein